MRTIVYDCEFIENGSTIDLISIGMVDKQGRDLYLVNLDCDETRASDWVRANVLPKLPPLATGRWKARAELAEFVRQFIVGDGEPVELWADYCAYDHVALAQLFGTMMDLPDGVPMFTHELMQYWEQVGRPMKPAQFGEHDALADAKHGMKIWKLCRGIELNATANA